MIIGWSDAPRAEPVAPPVILLTAERHDLAPVLRMRERVQRLQPLIDQHAQGEQCGAPDPMLAVDEHLLAPADMLANERDAAFQLLVACGSHVRSCQAQ